jgi:hypothetical protein
LTSKGGLYEEVLAKERFRGCKKKKPHRLLQQSDGAVVNDTGEHINLCHYRIHGPVMQHEMENQMATTGANGVTTITLDDAELAEYQEYKRHAKQRNVGNRLDEMGTVKAANRRQTLVMRRMKDRLLEIAPDEDIAAYGELHKLKKTQASDPTKKIFVSDNEIKAYKLLDPEFKATPTLDAIAAKVEELKATGQATPEGDNAEEPEDGGAGGGEGQEGGKEDE